MITISCARYICDIVSIPTLNINSQLRRKKTDLRNCFANRDDKEVHKAERCFIIIGRKLYTVHDSTPIFKFSNSSYQILCNGKIIPDIWFQTRKLRDKEIRQTEDISLYNETLYVVPRFSISWTRIFQIWAATAAAEVFLQNRWVYCDSGVAIFVLLFE